MLSLSFRDQSAGWSWESVPSLQVFFSFRRVLFFCRDRASDGPLFPAVVSCLPPAAYFLSTATKSMQKAPPETNGLWTPFTFKNYRSLWAVAGTDSATDPLPLPLRRRKYYVYRRGIRIPTISLRTVCTVVSRFPTTLWRENRDTFLKPPRCIRHRRHFGGFLGMPVRLGR